MQGDWDEQINEYVSFKIDGEHECVSGKKGLLWFKKKT